MDSEADAVVFDLEDAVPDGEKDRARSMVCEFVVAHRENKPLFVRVSPASHPRFVEDVWQVVAAGTFGVVVPKVRSREEMIFADQLIALAEQAHGRAEPVVLAPILETAQSIASATEVFGASARTGYAGGMLAPGGDVEQALGLRWTADGEESLVVRSLLLLAMRATGSPNPLTGTWADVADLDGLRRFAARSRALGYEGMAILHPSHAEVVNAEFDGDRQSDDYYREMLAALDAAAVDGRGTIRFRGRMVDAAMAEEARRVLATHQSRVSAVAGRGEGGPP